MNHRLYIITVFLQVYLHHFFPTANPINPPALIIEKPQNFTLPSVAVFEYLKFLYGLEHQLTPEKKSNQSAAEMIFAMGGQPLVLVAYNQWHRKISYLQWSLSGNALIWFLAIHGTYKNDCSAFVSAFKKRISSQKFGYYAQVEAQTLEQKKLKP